MAGVTSVVIDGTTYLVDDINAVDFSEDQGLSEQQQQQGRSNIGAAAETELEGKADEADLDALADTVGDLSDDVDGLTEALADKADVIVDTASGAIASFPDGAAVAAKDITIGIEPVQAGSGDPSPTNVRPISGWTGANVWDDPKHGGTVAWNQKVRNGNFADTSNWMIQGGTINGASNNELDVSFTDSGLGSNQLIAGVQLTNGHKHVSVVEIYNPAIGNTFTLLGGSYTKSTALTPSTVGWHKIYNFFDSTYTYWILRNTSGGAVSNVKLRNAMTFDLTQMFGTAIADQVYAMEQATPGAGVAWFRNLFPKDYYAYNVGEETCVSAVNDDPYTHIPISWQSEAGTVYGGALDVTTGLLTVTHGYIASYNGESLPGEWISSMDVYSAGGTPTTGAQVVYELATPQTYQLTPTEVDTLLGENNVWADTGDSTVAYRADTKLYIQKINAPTDDDMIADAQIASGKYFIVGGNLYKSTTTIPAGDTINPGSNCILTNLADALNALNT